MSAYLWKYYLEDDVESFCRFLDEAGTGHKSNPQKSSLLGVGSTIKAGSPGGLSASPTSTFKWREAGYSTPDATTSFHDVALSRADLNRRDGKGLTILHYAASSTSENAIAFALALIAHPLIDLYLQDYESGWTALHRAFYFGNITIARAIVERDSQIAIGQSGAAFQQGALAKVKDREGNGPYDLLATTINDRTLHRKALIQTAQVSYHIDGDEEEEEEEVGQTIISMNEAGDEVVRRVTVRIMINVEGDEVFTFGSNRNITLGFGDTDDRHFPERIKLKRPDRLYQRFHEEYLESQALKASRFSVQYGERIRAKLDVDLDIEAIPSMIRSKSLFIQDVQMAKFHTAVVTNDPEANLYICGHGLGGRLGTGSEKTQFTFTSVRELAHKKIIAVALGQDHTLAITEFGEFYSWGSNIFGQLGCGMPRTNSRPEEYVQMLPKQVFGVLKREPLIGVAASRIHSVAYTSTSLYTFGKNEGQLGIIDAHAGSLEFQATPRKVAASRFQAAIQSVAVIDRATVCLLENHEVHVLANYGIVKLVFPLDGFSNFFLQESFLTTNYDKSPNQVCKVVCGGETICALSTSGEVFTVNVDQRLDPEASSTSSTTKPNKIKSALSTPQKIWSLKKHHMNARDVAVDQDGTIILTTEAGSVWRRVRRPKGNAQKAIMAGDKLKDFKFTRVPGLTRILAVRASSAGAYCAIRRDCNVTKSQIHVDPQPIWKDTFSLLPYRSFAIEENSDTENPAPVFWRRPTEFELLKTCILQSKDLEKELQPILQSANNDPESKYDVLLSTTVSDVTIPVNEFILVGRSRILRDAFATARRVGASSNDIFSLQFQRGAPARLVFQGLDFLTLIEFVHYVYFDTFIGFWQRPEKHGSSSFRFRQVRTELMKLATHLELHNLESATRRIAPSVEFCLDKDLEMAFDDPKFFAASDAMIQLADGELPAHSVWLSRRCPFFEGLFEGHTGGMWLAQRRDLLEDPNEAVEIDMKHVETRIFKLVLRHIYADTGEELFDDVVTKDLDEFLDLVMDVLSVANELMLDRLSQICQKIIGRHVTVRNICQLLNAISPCSISEFKDSGLEYICLSLDALLSTHLLDELDEDLLHELDEVVKANQLVKLPFVRSGRAEMLLHEKHPEIAELIDRGRQAKLDAISLQAKFNDQYIPMGPSFDPQSHDGFHATPSKAGLRSRQSQTPSASVTPQLKTRASSIMLNFPSMDDMATPPRSSPSIPNTPDGVRPQVMSSPLARPSIEAGSLTTGSLSTALEDLGLPAGRFTEADVSSSPAATGSGFSQNGRPWGVTPLPSTKLSIKEMMEQAAIPKQSGLSMGLRSQSKGAEPSTTSSSSFKASQKERKQSQRLQSDAFLAAQLESPSPKTPWQLVSAGGKTSTNDEALPKKQATPTLGPAPTPTPTPTPIPKSNAQPDSSVPTPQLTMRQTVANNPATPKQRRASETPRSSKQQQRSVSTPQIPKAAAMSSPMSPGIEASTKAVPIQSVRHQPRPETSPTFYMHQSLADILSQQQAEKRSIKEAAAKRSLQEIQQEQEFQAWWDQASRRAIEEEAAAAKLTGGASSRPRGGGRGGATTRGRSRGRRGRGGQDTVETAESRQS